MASHRKDLYGLLGVDRRATEEAIRKAFRERAKQLHPDRNPGTDAAEQFKCIVEAYNILVDSQRRGRYMRTLLLLYCTWFVLRIGSCGSRWFSLTWVNYGVPLVPLLFLVRSTVSACYTHVSTQPCMIAMVLCHDARGLQPMPCACTKSSLVTWAAACRLA